jgi:membrane protease YdiL (CAAX protease family)
MMRITIVVMVVVATAVGLCLSQGPDAPALMWSAITLPYVALAAFAVYRMYDDGTVLDKLRIKGGDVTLGVLVAAVLVGGAWAVRQGLMPQGSPQIGWLFRVLLHVGGIHKSPLLLVVLLVLALAEEITWRGMVQDALTERFGSRRGWILCAVAYAVALIPSAFALSDPSAGPNPLLVLAGLGCGLFWSFTTSRLGRLPPAIVSHIAFSYFAPLVLLPKF